MPDSTPSSGGVDAGQQDRPVPAVITLSVPYSQLADVLAKLTAHQAIKQAWPLVFGVAEADYSVPECAASRSRVWAGPSPHPAATN